MSKKTDDASLTPQHAAAMGALSALGDSCPNCYRWHSPDMHRVHKDRMIRAMQGQAERAAERERLNAENRARLQETS
jgi:hypothetical protein